ncbi:hypothetical protein A2331_05505 [Candidatus Falkowbacteria bacterium RIFOXYB2_FULL_34_18]|uniref:Uncharacterized protein n=1 Tax=Candidatus Falkowbacteria bacterium RIFOXYD2_FULL_34_120 TaxID=1798007 RepID=A0A1F5TQW2_9BACT|nr:MAG: hypothetical protein A2331_05505 [Candidatus Falkowbacteria bacterium RIFOXYB2_FULL_34_18]OGF29836.1 MAG: hypothetical protein A2500_01525 [Candidatus Falkowbacteria bacterium RIFOXYC12_FULL_34_55]OGF37049.1 MAG: hypothetical protein A2466_05680 [Candidatus Falkowbacteria bacterium RIFOXYC2_FULL_34_220]OGF39241.1 MAG: hypothetical protein A2515_00890 [Candidatus Falkowbacteria bacterium RIFOXYD12_FULL_34_57]OGF41346.1 MAG: hypothetical protein A2531_07100 [Candidatus Falkowbacteria bact
MSNKFKFGLLDKLFPIYEISGLILICFFCYAQSNPQHLLLHCLMWGQFIIVLGVNIIIETHEAFRVKTKFYNYFARLFGHK